MIPWTALTLGFLGSFHCIGMCGPLALALPGGKGAALIVIAGRVYYNLGRICSYSVLGATFGLIGQSIRLAGFQSILSVVLGIAIIGAVVVNNRHAEVIKEKLGVHHLFSKLKKIIATQYRRKGTGTLFIIGILNGLLPCGFVYVGLAGSLTTGTIPGGTLYMALFGLGTFPAMLAVSLAPNLISIKLRYRINKVMPYLAFLLGSYLVCRGLMMSAGN